MLSVQPYGTDYPGTDDITAFFSPYKTASGWNPAPRGPAPTILVAHTSPLMAAGLSAVLRRLEGCEVRVLKTVGDAAVTVGSVLVVDDLAMAAQLSTCACAGRESMTRSAPKVVYLIDSRSDVDPVAMARKGVSAWLPIDCPEEDLLAVVQGLLEDALPLRRSAMVKPEVASPVAPNRESTARRRRFTGGLAPGALRRVREHIEACFAQKIDSSRLAEIAGLSASYFSRAFKQSIGMPPHRYVMTRRLAAAAELIRNTSKPLAVVAIDVGFSDQSHFTRIFTQMTGETPGALKRRSR
jgi:AraC-like DNA-binding protein